LDDQASAVYALLVSADGVLHIQFRGEFGMVLFCYEIA
jgi:hypothetical protein